MISDIRDDFDDGDDRYFEGGDEDDFDADLRFANPGGNSALRAATPDDPRIHPCPTCLTSNRLTKLDVQLGYQCDSCADFNERGGY